MKLRKLIITVLAAALSLGVFACSAGPTYSVSGRQDRSYAVTSQGGMAVQYGNYVYSVNGYRGFDDDGTQNVEVVKGAIFRSRLNGTDRIERIGSHDVKMFDSTTFVDTELDFYSRQGTDYDDNPIDIVETQQIAGKTVGTTGYRQGGLFIFDDYIYYASPSNEKDRQGNIETHRTEFFRSKIDGSHTERVYKSAGDTSSSPYVFHHYKGRVYLVVLDGTDLVSVSMTSDRIYREYTIASDVTSAVMPYGDIYFKGIDTTAIHNYIFFTRNVNDDDALRSGNVLELMRPDGSQRNIVIMNGLTVNIDSVRDGLLFYNMNVNTFTNVYYTDCSAILSGSSFDAASAVNGVALHNSTEYSSYYVFRQNQLSNIATAIAVTSDKVFFVSDRSSLEIFDGSAEVLGIHEDFVYLLVDSTIYRTRFARSQDPEQISESTINNVGLAVDFCAGHIVFLAQIDEWASDYTFFKKLNLNPNNKQNWVGKIISDDVKPEEDEDEI